MLLRFLDYLAASAQNDERAPELRISDRYANVEVTNQFGESFRFHDKLIKGERALIANTMYTTCRGSCPGTSATLESLRRILTPVLGDKLSIVSLTLEPEIDTEQKLLEYAEIYGAGKKKESLCDWHFVTGSKKDLEQLRRSLNFYELDPALDRDITQHASLLLFGNSKTDRWAAMPAELREPLLVESIRRIAGFTFEQRYGFKP